MEPVEREITELALKRCPLCDYSLTGLPDRHACPECGFSYDKRVLVETISSKRHLLAGLVLAAASLYSLCMWGWMSFRGTVPSFPGVFALLAPFFPMCGWFGYLWRRRVNNKIIVSDGSLQVIRKGKLSPVYSWDKIESVKRSNVNGCAIVYLRDGNTVKLFGQDFFGSHRKTEEFVGKLRRCHDEFRKLQGKRAGKGPEEGSPRLPDGSVG